MNWEEKDREFIWHPFTPLFSKAGSIHIESGNGVYLHTNDGRKIIDAISSWWVNLHGHSHPAIAEAIYSQAKKLEHVIFAGFTHEPAIQLAENLLHILPKNQSKIFFSDDGSTSVEVALKIAIQHNHNHSKRKKKIIAFQDAYHGDTFGSMSVGSRGGFNEPFDHFLFDVIFLGPPSETDKKIIIDQFQRATSQNDVAAFIYEPLVQAAAGMKMYDVDLLDNLLAIAKDRGVISIADEVFTGFGRTGKMFASEYLAHQPDIIAMSKGITGGAMALGATSCSAEILEPFKSSELRKTFFHGHSFTANPIACAAANASFKLLTGEQCQSAIHSIASQHTAFLNKIKDHRSVQSARSLGTILAIELRTDGERSYFNDIREYIYNFFIEKGILLRPLGNTIYLLPPYVITDDELAFIYSNIKEFLDEYSTQA